jgi:hypothetical protein
MEAKRLIIVLAGLSLALVSCKAGKAFRGQCP